MDKNLLFKSLMNGIIAFLGISLLMVIVKDATLVQAITTPYVIISAVCAAVVSYFGFMLKTSKR